MNDTIFQRKPYDVKYYMVKIQILQYKKLYRWIFDYYMTNFYNIMEYEILLDDSWLLQDKFLQYNGIWDITMMIMVQILKLLMIIEE